MGGGVLAHPNETKITIITRCTHLLPSSLQPSAHQFLTPNMDDSVESDCYYLIFALRLTSDISLSGGLFFFWDRLSQQDFARWQLLTVDGPRPNGRPDKSCGRECERQMFARAYANRIVDIWIPIYIYSISKELAQQMGGKN